MADSENNIRSDDISPLEAQPPCPVPAQFSEGPAQRGSCVGVLYRCDKTLTDKNRGFCINDCSTKISCVHNGRLVDSAKDYILVNHYTLDKHGHPKEETRIFYRSKTPQVIEYRRTPALPSSALQNCSDSVNPGTTGIVTSNCVGVYYLDPKKPHGRDIKNGRFAFWTDIKGTIHCTFKSKDISSVFRVYYYHFTRPVCVSGRAELTAELTCKENILGIYKLSQNNLGEQARC